MSYSIATFFDQDSWNKSGPNWLRIAESHSKSGYVVGKNLNEAARNKIDEFGYKYLELLNKNNNSMDAFCTLAYQLEKNESCLWSTNSFPNKDLINESFDVVCKLSDKKIDDLVVTVVNLYDRAAIRHSLKETMLKDHGGFLSSETIYGKYDFWHGYVGCGNYLFEKQYLDAGADNTDLILNFFMVFANVLKLQII